MTLVQMAQGMGDDAPAHEETEMRTHLDGARRKQKLPDASRFPISSITMSSSSDPTRFHVNTPRTTFSMVTIPVRTERAEDLDGKYIKSHSNPLASRNQEQTHQLQDLSPQVQNQPLCSFTPSSLQPSPPSCGLRTSLASHLAPYVCSYNPVSHITQD